MNGFEPRCWQSRAIGRRVLAGACMSEERDQRVRSAEQMRRPGIGRGYVERREPRLGTPNLRVDYSLLEASHKTLTSLASEFGNLQASTNGYDAAMGSGAIA